MTISKTKSLIIFGTGDLAAIAHQYFSNDSEYTVMGFVVDKAYIKDASFCGLPVAPFEDAHLYFPPDYFSMYVAIVYQDMNRLRARKCAEAEVKGYKLASYISSRAFVSPGAKIGKHAFIFEDNTIQPFVTIGDNNILWSGNHVGHHSVLEDNVFVSSHVVISGHCHIQRNCFLGVNSTLANNTVIGKESWLAHGVNISGEVPDHSLVRSLRSEIAELNEEALNRSLQRASEKAGTQ